MVENDATPETGQLPGPGPEVVKGQRVSKEQAARRVKAGQCRMR